MSLLHTRSSGIAEKADHTALSGMLMMALPVVETLALCLFTANF